MRNSETEQARWFADEVQPHDGALRSYLLSALPSRADADDLTQDSYVRLLRARVRGSIRSTRPLLFAIARNVVRDFFHRKAKADLVSLTDNIALPFLEGDAGLVESLCRQQELSLLSEAIAALPPRCREVLLLRKITGLPQREIARLLEISENTVESLSAKGVRRCSDYLRDRGVGPHSVHGPQR